MTSPSASAWGRAATLLWLCCAAFPHGAVAAGSVRGAPRAAALQARTLTVVGGNATANQVVKFRSGANQTAKVNPLDPKGAGGLVAAAPPPASVMRCATNTEVLLKSHDGSYLKDEEYLGGFVGDLFGHTLSFHTGAPLIATIDSVLPPEELLTTWVLEPVEPGDNVRIKNVGRTQQEGKPVYLTDTEGSVSAETDTGKKQEWTIVATPNFGATKKLLIKGSSGSHLENREGDVGLDLEITPIQEFEIVVKLDGAPACQTLGATGGASPPSDKETIAPGYCVNFNEGGSAGRGSGFSSFPGVDGEECFQKCRNDPMCLQAVYQEEGAGAPMCWTGVNTMPVKPAASRVGMVDHCMAKLGFNTGPDRFTKLGKGACPDGLSKYASNNAADAVNINVCQLKCTTEPECKFISFKEGVTCSRYDGGVGTCSPLVEDETMTTFRRDPASLYVYNPLGAGKCLAGWYTNGSPMDAIDLTACQTACTLESNCKFISYQAGKACVRFNELAAPCLDRPDGKADHTTYQKSDSVMSPPPITPAPRGAYRTDFGRCVFDEFMANPAATDSVAGLACYTDCLQFKASYAPRMCQRMCINAFVQRGRTGEAATNNCVALCPAAAAKVYIADFICPPQPTTPKPEPPKP